MFAKDIVIGKCGTCHVQDALARAIGGTMIQSETETAFTEPEKPQYTVRNPAVDEDQVNSRPEGLPA